MVFNKRRSKINSGNSQKSSSDSNRLSEAYSEYHKKSLRSCDSCSSGYVSTSVSSHGSRPNSFKSNSFKSKKESRIIGISYADAKEFGKISEAEKKGIGIKRYVLHEEEEAMEYANQMMPLDYELGETEKEQNNYASCLPKKSNL